MHGWLTGHAFSLALVGVAVWLAGLALAALGVARRRRATAPSRWPTVPGLIRGSDIRAVGENFEPRVRYTYAVAGHVYQGHAIEPGPRGPFTRTEAANLALRYAPECAVDVHYDPEAPARSVLQAHAARAGVLAIALGVAIVGLGALTLLTAVVLSQA